MATAQINQKMHDIAEARWKMLPIAVQREHEILAMDISELQWHVKQEKQELIKAEEKLDYASTINKGGFQSLTLHTLKSRELVLLVEVPYTVTVRSIWKPI